MDFDTFLAAPAESLQALASFFDAALNAQEAERLAGHPLMGRYSKAVDYEYGREQREAALAAARREHGKAIGEGLSWLESAARAIPAIDRCAKPRQRHESPEAPSDGN